MQSIPESCVFCSVIEFLAYGLFGMASMITILHIITTIYLKFQPHLKLTSDSFVVITGACLGIGREMAIEIAKLYHCKIMIVDYRDDLFPQVEAILSQLGAKCESYRCDLADDQSVQKFINQLNKRNQPIDLFIHNAGIIIPKRALAMTENEFMMLFKVNFLSPVKIMRETIKLVENGHIGITASVVALTHGGLDVSAYTASKHALYGFVNSFRQQLKADKKRTTISMGCPFFIKTGMFDGFKTKLDFMFKHLEPKYVGQRLVREFVMKKQICFVYQYEALLFKIFNLFPSPVLDNLSINLNISNLTTIQNRHDERAKNLK